MSVGYCRMLLVDVNNILTEQQPETSRFWPFPNLQTPQSVWKISDSLNMSISEFCTYRIKAVWARNVAVNTCSSHCTIFVMFSRPPVSVSLLWCNGLSWCYAVCWLRSSAATGWDNKHWPLLLLWVRKVPNILRGSVEAHLRNDVRWLLPLGCPFL